VTPVQPSRSVRCSILNGMEDPFDFPKLRIQQPGRLLSTRASYEIFNGERRLLATATETEAHHRLKVISKAMPDTRVLAVTAAGGEPILTLIKQASVWITELHDPEGELIGRIRTSGTRRHYTLLDDEDEVVGRVEGDLALKHFSVKGTAGEFARVRKTFAGLTKEVLTASDHYKVDFAGPVSAAARTLTVMMPIVLDLTLYGPT
jgi:Scramblase